tara:strand:- start:1814 stop:2800 length:987 start_codon:yes stop_codon:yes gene_type:complete
MENLIEPEVLITGASGFIGRHAQAHLLDAGFSVRVLLRSETSFENDCHSKLKKYYGNLTDAGSLRKACEGVDYVVHLAGIAHVNEAKKDYLHKINVNGTKLLINAAIASKVKKFVLVSSSLAVESMGDPHSSTAYGATKLMAEKLIMDEHIKGNILGVVLRPANVYGAGMRGNIALLIRLISRGLVPKLPTLENRVSMLGVNDLSLAIYLSLKSERANGRTYLVTDGQQYSISAIEREIYGALGKKMSRLEMPRVLLYSMFSAADLLGRILRIFRLDLPILGNINLRTYRRLVSDNLFESNQICDELFFEPQSTFYSELPKIVGKIGN